MFLRIDQVFAKLEDSTSWKECNKISSPTSWSKQHQLLAETKSLSSQVLKTSKNEDCTTFLYSLFQCFTVFMVNRLFFTSNSPNLSFQLLPSTFHHPAMRHFGNQTPFSRELPAGARGLPFGLPRHCPLHAEQARCLSLSSQALC